MVLPRRGIVDMVTPFFLSPLRKMGYHHHKSHGFAISLAWLLLLLCQLPSLSSAEEDHNVTSSSSSPVSTKSFMTLVIPGEVNKTDTRAVNSTIQYIYQYTINSTLLKRSPRVFNEDVRVKVTTTSVDTSSPVLFVVRQQTAVLSWPLPIISNFDRKLYQAASRTLCSDAMEERAERTVFVSVSSSSIRNVTFSIEVLVEENFLLELNKTLETDVAPLSPRIFRFVFPPKSINKFVLLEVNSENDNCMTVSVQNASCPILDQENNVQFEGYWQTMTKKAGMTLRRDEYPDGFYVVFVMHGDDSRCRKVSDDEEGQVAFWSWFLGPSSRVKHVSFNVTEKISDIQYLTAIFGTVGIFSAFYAFSFIVSCAYLFRSNPEESPVSENEEGQPPSEPEAGPSGNFHVHHHSSITPIYGSINNITNNNGIQNNEDNDEEEDADGHHWLADTDSSLDETDLDMLEDAHRDKDVYRTSRTLCVAALARKNPRVLAKKSQLYLWTLLTVAIFYGLPVAQLVFTYQTVLHTTGNQDLCYYNYLCSHPLWPLSDFNHVYSNIGYMMLGVLFLLLVWRREKLHEKRVAQFPAIEVRCGIPRHFGMFYAMGVALIMEGVLSACYHVCPNHSNFQFDTCFMYVNAMLLMLKIYQTRHPDINASAYMAFSALALVVLLGVVGVLASSIYFWVSFTVFHVTMGLYLSVQIYYLGRWRCDCGVFRRIYNTWKNDCLASPLLCLRPLYIDRMILLIIANLSNWAIAWFGFYNMKQDFASHLLIIFMVNLFLYSNFYIIMKLTHREKITFQPMVYIILSIIFWTLSMFVFLHRSTSWQKTPAESRTYNQECMLLRFYDTHDIWHFLSAASMFFSFMILLTLDDDLVFIPRTKIPVF